MAPRLRAFLLVVALSVGLLSSSTHGYPSRSTISDAAQAALRSMGPASARPLPTDLRTYRAQANAGMIQGSTAAQNKYIGKVETLRLGGVRVLQVTPKLFNPANEKTIGVYIHGGGYAHFSPEVAMQGYASIAAQLGIRVIAIAYRLAPEAPFPAAVNDCHAVYTALLKRYLPRSIIMWGDSAGGTLVAATLLRAQAARQPMPAAVALIAPWADMSPAGEASDAQAATEPVLDKRMLALYARAYMRTGDLKNPLASPVYATSYSWAWPPTLILVGTRDMFLSMCLRLYQRMKGAGVQVTFSRWEGMWHGFQLWNDLPEGAAARAEVATYLGRFLA